MAFGDHLDELRRRLVFALLGPIPIMILCLVFGGEVLEFLLVPLESALRSASLPARLQATGPAETIAAYLKISVVLAVLASGPWILYQGWLFVAPGLYAHERRFVYFLMPLSVGLTAVGAVFLYTVLLPVSLRFLVMFGTSLAQVQPGVALMPEGMTLPQVPALMGDPAAPAAGEMWINEKLQELRIAVAQGSEGGVRIMSMPLAGPSVIVQQYRVSEYVNMVFVLGLVFAAAFQLPLALLLLGWTGLVEPDALTKKRKHVLFGCVVAAAVVTPTVDPWTLMLLAGPLYGLFEFGVVLMRLVPARRVAGAVDQAPELPERLGRREGTDGDQGDE